jgi:hypothetical protein
MIMKMFSIFDAKAETFMPPFCVHSVGIAKRDFSDAVNDGKSFVNKHPEDYSLFEIGTYDDQTGQCDMLATPLSHGVGISYKIEE